MGDVIDLHEVSRFKDVSIHTLNWHYRRYLSYGMRKECHKIHVELHFRRVAHEANQQAKARRPFVPRTPEA